MTNPLPRPDPAEYAEYYRRYVDLVPDGDVMATLRDQLEGTLALLTGLSEQCELRPYAPGKWSLREAVAHCVDVERVMSFRALAMAREGGLDLPRMDPDVWAQTSRADARPLSDHAKEWITVRRASVHLFATFDEATGLRTGRASGNPFTVRTFPWIVAGHELWHRRVIAEHYLAP